MDSLTLITCEKSPNKIEIRPDLTYSVCRGLLTGLAATKVPLVLKILSLSGFSSAILKPKRGCSIDSRKKL